MSTSPENLNALDDFRTRGLLFDCTGEAELRELLSKPPVTLYAGFDPTADSLHIGSLVPLLGLARMQRAGHRPIALAGGATGLVGDPSGKSDERNMLSTEILEKNVAGIRKQMERFLDFDAKSNPALLVDNAQWFRPIGFLQFLRDVGKHFTVNQMIARDSVRSRLDRDSGISYTEFSYMLLQAYDFLHLFRTHGCTLQIGGSDQWGNMVSGTDLIRKMAKGKAWAMTMPLIMTSSGAKFGKTEKGAVWLDKKRTSPYELYQYFVRTDDRDVVQYLSYFTFLSAQEIAELTALHEAKPHARDAHRRLAWEVANLVHGEADARSAVAASGVLYGGSVDDISEADLLMVAQDMPRTSVSEAFGGSRMAVDLFVLSGLAKSRGQAKRLLEQGGVYVNNVRRSSDAGSVTGEALLFGRYLLLRAGKKNYHLLEFPTD